jgi:hypothetical protein
MAIEKRELLAIVKLELSPKLDKSLNKLDKSLNKLDKSLNKLEGNLRAPINILECFKIMIIFYTSKIYCHPRRPHPLY